MKILVTGATGQLGQEFMQLAKDLPWQFIYSSTRHLDLLDLPKVADYIRFESFDYILNFAAYTAVDKAESEPDKAFALNADAVFNMVQAAEWVGTKIIHISTDYVFDGRKCQPYTEIDPVNPLSIYGKSKAKGEQFVLNYHGGMVIRTSWLYSHYGNNFVKTMLRLARERETITVVYDQIGTPTYAGDLAAAILHVLDWGINRQMPFPSGEIFHFSNEGVASWYDFAREIFDLAHIKVDLQPIETKQFPRPAQRPFYSVLSKDKFKKIFKFSIPHWKDSLKTLIKDLAN